jgi:cytochrome c
MRTKWIISLALVAISGCGGAQTAPARTAAPATFADQVAAGGSLYGAHCASCHGDHGQGTERAPRVVGLSDGALPLDPPPTRMVRHSQFRTVADVADFVVHNMPRDAPGSLREDEYWSILAFDLHANGVDLQQPLDASVAQTLTIPR